MAIKHRNKQRVPVDLEPSLMEHVVSAAKCHNLPRTTFIRTLIKYGMCNLENAIENGDKLWTSTKEEETQ